MSDVDKSLIGYRGESLMARFAISNDYGGWESDNENPVVGDTFDFYVGLSDDPQQHAALARIIKEVTGEAPSPKKDMAKIPLSIKPVITCDPENAITFELLNSDEVQNVQDKAQWKYKVTAHKAGDHQIMIQFTCDGQILKTMTDVIQVDGKLRLVKPQEPVTNSKSVEETEDGRTIYKKTSVFPIRNFEPEAP